ncbi:ankyrin repeat-containing protein [Rutstroemia sp. NJR-2017a BVV2]|nr:ankyrin repeat-containing protein [Rutstroemia sp. NJR-2017a BVV2]
MADQPPRSLTHDDYTVGWICALPLTELVAAIAMLDEEHSGLPAADSDTNVYALGRIGVHNVVIACLPAGVVGKVSAAMVAKDMLRSFKAIRFALMVGVGGGAPLVRDLNEVATDDEDSDEDSEEEFGGTTDEKDIRLGDIVISQPFESSAGVAVVQYDFGKSLQGGKFHATGTLNKPPEFLLKAIAMLQAKHVRKGTRELSEYLEKMVSANPGLASTFVYQGANKDRLFKEDFVHLDGKKSCKACCGPNDVNVVKRKVRPNSSPAVHYGTIGSADQVMKDSVLRNKWAKERNIICFEMEAAGLMDNFPCLVIRGICDYADSHKNKAWQPYAAATAAAYAKELLYIVPGKSVVAAPPIPPYELDSGHIYQSRLSTWLAEITKGISSVFLLYRRASVYREGDLSKMSLIEQTYHLWVSLLMNKLVQHLQEVRRTDEEEQCLQALRTTNYEDQKNTNTNRAEGTCLWCLEDSLFVNWRDRLTSRLLWITADPVLTVDPGCGKSVLSKALVDENLLGQQENDTVVCYFFFKDTSPEQRSPVSALSALLHQLFASRQGSHLIKHALPHFRKNKDRFATNLETLWTIVQSIIEDPEHPRIIFLLDALDECKSDCQQALIMQLKRFEKMEAPGRNGANTFQFIITSRPYWDIEREFQELIQAMPNIRLPAEDKSKLLRLEISCVIEARLDELERSSVITSATARNMLRDGLSNVENRTYLWIRIIFARLVKEPRLDIKTIRKFLNELPPSVEDAYEAILKRSKEPEDAKRLLHIIVAAKRPLFLKEIAVALYITDEVHSHEDLEIQEDSQLKITLRHLCGLFVSIVDGKNWFKHVREALEIDDSTKTMCLDVCNVQSHYLRLWPHIYHRFNETGRNMYWYLISNRWSHILFVLAYFGLDLLMAEVCKHMADVDIRDGNNGTPLILAAGLGHETVVSLLLHKQANVNSQDSDGNTPLINAVSSGHEMVVKILLDKGADVNMQDRFGRTALMKAAQAGSEAVVKLLLDKPNDVNMQDSFGMTALMVATQCSNEGVVKLLLDKHADINIQYRNGTTALIMAIANGGDNRLVKILLDKQSDVNLQNGTWGSTLHAAFANGKEQFVEALLKEGTDVGEKEGEQGTALQAAVRNHHEISVKMLLNKQVAIHEQDRYVVSTIQKSLMYESKEIPTLLLSKSGEDLSSNHGRALLLWAVEHPEARSVELVLTLDNIEIDFKDTTDQAPLLWARQQHGGNEVEVLLPTGKVKLNPSLRNHAGRAPLLYATEFAGEDLLQLLLQAKKHYINSRDIIGQTPLSHAALYANKTAAKLLLETGAAELNSKDNDGRTPLSWAADSGAAEVVELLLKEGNIEADSKDNAGWTPLSWAARQKKLKTVQVVELLLRTDGVEVDSKDNCNRTPLSFAAQYGSSLIIESLLKTGKADVEWRDDSGRTPLLWALRDNGIEEVETLLNIGKARTGPRDIEITAPLALTTPYSKLGPSTASLHTSKSAPESPYQVVLMLAVKMDNRRIVTMLLEEEGIEVDMTDEDGRTPLSWAAQLGYEYIVKVLLAGNASIDLEDMTGRTPLSWALEFGRQDVVNVMHVSRRSLSA